MTVDRSRLGKIDLLSLPRGVYWGAGGAVALAGALAGRIGIETYPDDRIAIWMVSSAIVFVGLAVVSLGTRWRQKVKEAQSKKDGAGEGDRTLV